MSQSLDALKAARNEARSLFIAARVRRDRAARFYDAVVAEGANVTQPAWDAYCTAQAEMDLAGERLYYACDAIASSLMHSRRGPGHTNGGDSAGA